MKFMLCIATLAAAFALPSISIGSSLYMENFEVDHTANWTVNNGPSDEAHDFFFDYSTLGIPASPNSAATGLVSSSEPATWSSPRLTTASTGLLVRRNVERRSRRRSSSSEER